MKVLDLRCTNQHVFEGWFASEEDFSAQCQRALVQCPICGDASISKMLSAPRLNLGAAHGEGARPSPEIGPASNSGPNLQTAWMEVARHIVATTDDVGTAFAEEARKIHYGEVKQRGIRGKASPEEAQQLAEEGISVATFSLPLALKGGLQ